jgi:hypothetical protein
MKATSEMRSVSPKIVMTATLLEIALHGILTGSLEMQKTAKGDLETGSTETNPSPGTRTSPMSLPRLLPKRRPPLPISVNALTAQRAGEIAML